MMHLLGRPPLENPYSYVDARPTDFVDALGLKPGDWWDVAGNAERAREIASEELALHPGHNDMDDAERHAEWSSRMTDELGDFYAWAFGVAHELDDLQRAKLADWLKQPGVLAESLMDLHNNREGRNAACESRTINPAYLQTLPTPLTGRVELY